MAGYDSFNSANKGSANLEALQYLQEQLGDAVLNGYINYVQRLDVTASATGGTAFTSVPVGAEIIDVTVHCTATNGSGTLQLTDADGNAITDAIACATLDALDRADSIDQTYKKVTADGLKIVSNGNDDRGEMYIFCKK